MSEYDYYEEMAITYEQARYNDEQENPYTEYTLLECLYCGTVFKDQTPDVHDILDNVKLHQHPESDYVLKDMAPNCPHCGRGWFQDTDESERPPTKPNKAVKDQKPFEFTEEEVYWIKYYALYRYLSQRGVPHNRAHIRAKSITEHGASVDWSVVLNQERVRSYKKKSALTYMDHDTLSLYDQSDSSMEIAIEPEDNAEQNHTKGVKRLVNLIDKYWFGTREELVEAIEIKWPGDEASNEERQKYKRLKDRLYLFRKRIENLIEFDSESPRFRGEVSREGSQR